MRKYQLLFLLLLNALAAFCQNTEINKDLTGKWKGQIIRNGKPWTTEIDHWIEQGKLKGYANFPDYGLYHYNLDSIKAADSVLIFANTAKNSEFIFSGILNNKNIHGKWDGLGLHATFFLAKENNSPLIISEKEISFSNKDADLSGTIILPAGKGPFPAIVQVHGSGNQTRTEDFYRSRAYLFAQNGIAVLIYDRRGRGKSTGKEVSMELLADDAIAGIHYLQQQKFIKKNKVGIMGFSQGGYVAPLAASRSKDIAFIIAGSAPGVQPDEQNDFDVENKLRNNNLPADSITYVINFRKELREFKYTGKGNKEQLQEKLSEFRKKKWFSQTLLSEEEAEVMDPSIKKFLTYDPLIAWKKIKVPVLLVWGDMDDAVPVEKSKKEIENALQQAGNGKYQTKIFSNASHGIAVVNGEKGDWPRLAEGYHELLVSWTKNNIKLR